MIGNNPLNHLLEAKILYPGPAWGPLAAHVAVVTWHLTGQGFLQTRGVGALQVGGQRGAAGGPGYPPLTPRGSRCRKDCVSPPVLSWGRVTGAAVGCRPGTEGASLWAVSPGALSGPSGACNHPFIFQTAPGPSILKGPATCGAESA